MSVAFSSSSEDCIEKKIEISADLVPRGEDEARIWESLNDYFEIPRVVEWIKINKFDRVALQLPDHLLKFSVRIVKVLEETVGDAALKLFVLGDTSYGSCCVDEVAAEHGLASAIVHFGPSCLSPPSVLPVLFVFGREQIDVDHLFDQCVSTFSSDSNLIFFFDPLYSHAEDTFGKKLKEKFENSIIGRVLVPSKSTRSCGTQSSTANGSVDAVVTTSQGNVEEQLVSKRQSDSLEVCRRTILLPPGKKMEEFVIVYVGMEGPALNNLILQFHNDFFTYNPKNLILRKETLNVNKTFLRRYYLIEKAKDANIIGILAGTLGVANYMDIMKRLKELIKAAGKKSYTFVVGKINVPKLANFQEIEAFVLVACPENSLIESREFFQPVLTPFELEVALNPNREWKPKMVSDFRKLLPGESDCIDFGEFDAEQPSDVSLITGKLRKIGRSDDEEKESTSEKNVVKRNDGLTVANVHTGAGYLQNRSWKGLEQNLGQTEIKKATEGAKGIAMGYENEKDAHQ